MPVKDSRLSMRWYEGIHSMICFIFVFNEAAEKGESIDEMRSRTLSIKLCYQPSIGLQKNPLFKETWSAIETRN